MKRFLMTLILSLMLASTSFAGTMVISGDFNKSSYIEGLNVGYSSTTAVTVSAGKLTVDDVLVNVSGVTHTIVNFDSGGFTYLYVNGSGTITDSVTEPTEQSDGTWYNGNLRCIGALYCDSASTLKEVTVIDHSSCEIEFFWTVAFMLANNFNPSSAWVDTTNDADDYTPVNTKKVLIRTYGADPSSQFTAMARSKVYKRYDGSNWAYNSGYTMIDISVPSYDRSIEIYGIDDDDNQLSAHIYGYSIRR